MTGDRGEVSLNQRMVLAAVKQQIRQRAAKKSVRRDLQTAEQPFDERQHELVVGRPHRRRDRVEERG